MLIAIPYHDRDRFFAERLIEKCRQLLAGSSHQLLPIFVDDFGVVHGDLAFCVRPLSGVYTAASLLFGVLARAKEMKSGRVLWLEPDCVVTRASFADEINSGFSAASESNKNICMFGHRKSDQSPLPNFDFVSGGCAVYDPASEALWAAIRGCARDRPADQQISERLGPTLAVGCDPKLIRCFWGWREQAYLEGFGRSAEKIVASASGACVIHGDRGSAFHDIVYPPKKKGARP